MSIILKGIDMPKEGEHIVTLIKSNGKCSYWKQETEYGICEPMQTAEAIQIPTPHGDIKDINTFLKNKCLTEYIENDVFNKKYSYCVGMGAICNAPTILEAEGEE